MANLDVNYLSELRQTFYTAEHQNQASTRGKKKQKHKTKAKNTFPKLNSNAQSNGNITVNNIPFQPNYVNLNGETPHRSTETAISLSNANHQNVAPSKGKKKLKSKFTCEAKISNTQSSEKIRNRIETPYKLKKKDHTRTRTNLKDENLSTEPEIKELKRTVANQTKAKKKLKSKFTISNTQSGEKIKNRIETPFKLKKTYYISLIDENPGRGTKRRLSSETEPEIKLKKKKEKPLISKGIQLNFSEDEVFATNSTDSEEFIKMKRGKPEIHKKVHSRFDSTKGDILKKKKKVSWSSDEEKKQKSSSNPNNALLKNKKKDTFVTMPSKKKLKTKPTNSNLIKIHQENKATSSSSFADMAQNFQISKTNGIRSVNINNSETAHDFYDDEISVTGMNLKNFYNLFTDSGDEDFIETKDFEVPRKFYKASKKLNVNAKTIDLISQNYVVSDEATVSEDNTDNQIQSAIETVSEEKQSNPPIIIKLTNNNQVVIIPEPNQLIHFYGLCYLQVLNGEVEILGATLTKGSPKKKLYSPRGTSLLYIKNTCKQHCSDTIKIKNVISSDLLNVADLDLVFEQHSAILLYEELKEPYMDFIESHMPQIMFPEATLGPRVDFQVGGNWNKTMEYSNLWESTLDCMLDAKTVICGGKGVGKSTFLRYIVNLLLGKFPKVRIVDLDSGQSEFFAPGFIGIVTVEGNVLGPNYTHMQPADVSILSHINIGHDIQQYSKSVKYLTAILDKMPSMPTLINFPGYTQGFGLDLTVNLLKLLRPQIVIEIKSKNNTKNYKTDLNSDNTNSYVGILGQEDIHVNYQYFKFDSKCEKNEAWALEARPSREICVLSYFGQMMSEDAKSLTCHNLNMFSINISALTIVNFAGNVINPVVVNGCLVGLCSLEQDSIFVSYGLGLVRGLDLENDYLVLLTPEKDLDKVTHLVLTSVSTPPSLLMSASGVRGNIPFVNKGELVDFGQFTKRSYLPPVVAQKRG